MRHCASCYASIGDFIDCDWCVGKSPYRTMPLRVLRETYAWLQQELQRFDAIIEWNEVGGSVRHTAMCLLAAGAEYSLRKGEPSYMVMEEEAMLRHWRSEVAISKIRNKKLKAEARQRADVRSALSINDPPDRVRATINFPL